MADNQITVQRDLRESQPLWATTPHISVRSFSNPPRKHYDIIIIGAGISGALVAEALADGKRSIAVIDRRAPVKGSSMASTAMLQHEIDVPLYKMVKSLGEPVASRVWQRSAQAVEDLQNLVSRLNISCNMEAKRTLYLAGDTFGSRALAMEAEARHKAGIEAQLLSQHELQQRFNIDRTSAIESSISASANPAQLTAGLLRAAQSRKTDIIKDTEITDFTSTSDKVVMATADGALLTCQYAIFCTGYEFLEALANKDHQIMSTWAIATKPHAKLPDWLADYLVWEGSDPYLYFRTTKDGRLLAGGEDKSSSDAYLDADKLKQKSTRIAEKIGDLLHCKIGKPEFCWAAAFGNTALSIPMIGEVPAHKNVYSVMGYGGNGITFSKIAADIISGAINNKPDPDADLFPFR